ncbi:MAG: L-aspartate oxidase [bacterium]|nr:L-aspartate oxidase [bacterium]
MVSADFLVIGSGIAGLTFALKAAEHGSVAILCKREMQEGNTLYAQGGIASVTNPEDSFASHVTDTLQAGAGLCDPAAVNFVIERGPLAIKNLVANGTNFDKIDASSNYDLAKEGGHSRRRILHSGDSTGAEIEHNLVTCAQAKHPIRVFEHHVAIDLILDKASGEVSGAYALSVENQRVETFAAKITVLATGGAGKVYKYTSNSDVATGDGIAMAHRAGAEIRNMEFFQFHPTVLYHPQEKSFLITEAMRGEGAKLITLAGERFMPGYHPLAELAPRDVVARAIDAEMKKNGDDYVLLDITHQPADFIRRRFPTIYSRLLELGIDITEEAIPVVPAAHYCCGGIVSDLKGRTTLPRLYAIGECACTGLHGANRLASNSLLEALVLGDAAATDAVEQLPLVITNDDPPNWNDLETSVSSEEVLVSHSWDEVRMLMWNLVGIVRSNKRLKYAKRRIDLVNEEVKNYYWNYRITPDLIELRNIITVADLIIGAAIERKESIGLHYNSDYSGTQSMKFHKTSQPNC